MRLPVLAAAVYAAALSGSSQAQDMTAPEYPETRRGDTVETLFGEAIADPYRWLEEDVRNSAEVADWVELRRVFDWSRTHVHGMFALCWGAQAALQHFHGIPKHQLPEKRFGVFTHRVLDLRRPASQKMPGSTSLCACAYSSSCRSW